MSYTPGPWDIRLMHHADCEREEGGGGRGFSRFVIAAPSGAAIQGAIAMTPLRYAEFEAADKANARLIAAAPELLDALKDLAYTTEAMSAYIPSANAKMREEYQSRTHHAWKCIRKAEGRGEPCAPTEG